MIVIIMIMVIMFSLTIFIALLSRLAGLLAGLQGLAHPREAKHYHGHSRSEGDKHLRAMLR